MARRPLYFISLLAAMLLTMPCALSAAQTSETQKAKWMEEIRKYKFELFTKELNLTKEQQQEFFPLYEEMELAVYKVNKEADELMDKIAGSSNVSDTEYEAAALAITKKKQREGDIEMEYFAKFEKILTKKQLFLLKKAEDKFTRNLLNHHRQRGGR